MASDPRSTSDPAPVAVPPAGQDAASGLEPWSPDPTGAPGPADREPEGYVVLADGDVRIHFLDWDGPGGGEGSVAPQGPGVLLVPGLLQPASSWAPVARRIAAERRTVVADLRGQGLSDSPMEGYDLDTLAGDAIAAAQGSGLLGDGRIVVAGHGFGGLVAVTAARALGAACAGLVLVDGGWERTEATTGVDVDEFLRGLDEPPEVMRTMDAFLKDRRAFDPGTWDADQERAARDAVVETAAGRVVRAVRPHVVEALVRTMFGYEPAAALRLADVPVIALVALAGEREARLDELRRTAAARAAAGMAPIRVAGYPSAGHNLMRYRPADVAAAILEVSG